MRRAFLSFVLLATSCTFGDGVQPPSPSTAPEAATIAAGTAAVTTTAAATPADPATRAAALFTARSFLDALSAGEWNGAATMIVDAPEDLPETLAAWSESITLVDASYAIGFDYVTDELARVGASATLTPKGFQAWRFETALDLAFDGSWKVVWSPSILYPGLADGDRLVVEHDWAPRGAILARDGTALVRSVPIWSVGVVPGRIEDLDVVVAVLEEAAGIPGDTVRAEIAKPGVQADWFVPVGSLPTSATEAAATLSATPGILLREATERVSLSPGLAAHVVGAVGPITTERLDVLGPPYGPNDLVGVSGIEQSFERQLAGTPDARIVWLNRYGQTVETLLEATGTPPESITTTIDLTVQMAAERALEGISKRAAVVIVDTETSEVLASVSRPIDGFDRAFLGSYPPGSTFKIVTAAALLEEGMSPEDRVDCPAEVTLGGAHFRNAGGRDLGRITLATAFAESCNTTFTALAVQRLSNAILGSVAMAFGFETDPDAGLPAATPRYPEPVDTAELAASAMGQGRVLVTPLEQASIAAAVAAGGWLPPTVIVGETDRVRVPLDPGVASDLADLMLLVVTDGTAGNARVPGEVVRAKTGSAEYNDAGDTHAWIVGYWNRLAFAGIVEDGGSGGQTAAPIAAAIIQDLVG